MVADAPIRTLDYAPDLFVNREEEVRLILDQARGLAAGARPASPAITFTGERGMGKSWLLRHLQHRLRQELPALAVVHLDLRRLNPATVAQALQAFGRQLPEPAEIAAASLPEMSRALIESARRRLEDRPLVLLLDHVFEWDRELLPQLEDYLLGPLAIEPRTLLVMAGRGREYSWRTPELRSRPLSLPPFHPEDTARQIERQAPQPRLPAAEVHQLGGGYPLSNYFLATLGLADGVEASVQEILQAVPAGERAGLRERLEALCVLKSFDEERLKVMLAEYYEDRAYLDWSYAQAKQVREQLVRLGYAQWREEEKGYVLDHAIQTAIAAALRHGGPPGAQKWARLHGEAARLFETWASTYPEAEVQLRQQMEYHLGESYRTARAVPRLVGRHAERQAISEAIAARAEDSLVYIWGPGGIGKSRLAGEILSQYADQADRFLVASEIIDVYHTFHRTPAGLAAAIQRVLAPDGAGFEHYRAERRTAEEAYVKSGWRRAPEAMLRALIDDLRALTRTRRLILVLDTAEMLFYEDPAANALGQPATHLPGLEWLFTRLLPEVQNAVIILAGRTEPDSVRQRLRLALERKRFVPLELKGFSQAEVGEYFAAEAEMADKDGDDNLALWIRAVSAEQQQHVFRLLSDRDAAGQWLGVPPILLALLIDYLAVFGRLPYAEPAASQPESAEIDADRAALFAKLTDVGRPAEDVIRHLARARKGMDAELLARLSGWRRRNDRPPEDPAAWDLDRARRYLDSPSVRRLSFVKIRPADRRLFLHDAIYAWREQQDWAQLDATSRRAVIHTLHEYYRARIRRAQQRVAELFQAARTRVGLPDPEEVAQAKDDEARSLVEELYYHLHGDLQEGFEKYYCYAEESLAGGDDDLLFMLGAELQAFLDQRRAELAHAQISGRPCQAVITADAVVRWVKREVHAGRHEAAVQLAERLRGEPDGALAAGDEITRLELNSWEGLARTRLGQFEEAEELLRQAVHGLTALPDSPRQKVALARAQNNRGYLLRLQGYYHAAVSSYRSALTDWRATHIESEQATTLTNIAFVRAELGEFAVAWQQAWDAREFREKRGPFGPTGLTINTLAHIKIRENNLDDAIHYAEEALRLCAQAELERGRALALTALAEAKRRISDWDRFYPLQTEWLLNEAARHAEEAVQIWQRTVTEPASLVDALIELGCAYRDLAKFLVRRGGGSAAEAAGRSRAALDRAIEIAAQNRFLHQQVNALVNTGWLDYYLGRSEEALAQLSQAEAAVPVAYRFAPGKGQPTLKASDAIFPLAAHLGKAELLRGHIAYIAFENQKDLSALARAVEHYALSLEYDALFTSGMFRDMRRGTDRMYERLKKLNDDELRFIRRAIEEMETRYRIRADTIRAFLEERALM